jgi:hypothetical protein
MIDIKDPNVDIPEGSLREAVRIVMGGGNGADIYRAQLLTSLGTPVSERQARRYKQAAEGVIEELPKDTIDRMLVDDNYMPDMVLEEEETSYPPILVPPVNNRTAVVDIEVLSPSFNRMGRYSHFLLCASFLPLDTAEVYTLNLRWEDQRDDRRLLHEALNELAKFEFIIGHNVKGYDINWLMTRCMFYGWYVPKRIFYYDTFSASKRIPIATRKSLGHLMDFFRITEAEKTQIMPVEWDRVRSPHQKDFEEAMSKIVYHCENDVVGNKRLYDIIYRYDTKPSWKLWPN